MRAVRLRAVALKNIVIALKESANIDMREDVIAYFQDRFERADKKAK